MANRYFGTDGIRGRVGAGPITPEFVLKLGWAVGKYFAGHCPEGQKAKVIIGKDTRISGYMFESSLEAGLVAAGVDVALIGPMPTPAIAYLARTFHAQAGIVISASHNPYHDNGIKFFSGDGNKLPDAVEAEIESQIDQPMTTVDSAKLGKVTRIADAGGRYIEYCKSTVPNSFSLAGMKIVLDCAHGATYQVAPAVFDELGAEVVTLGAAPNGININENVGSTSPQQLQTEVIKQKADLGIAFDGDGDRVCFVDRVGELVDGDELLYIIARAQQAEGACPGVVGTLMSNYGLELALAELSIPFTRAKVGDRYVNEQLKDRGWLLGGENSGHVICKDVSTTGDGIVAALKVLSAVVASGETLHQLKSGMSKLPQIMINVRIADRFDLNNVKVQAAMAAADETLAGAGRTLLRASGTEPLIRVMVEGKDLDQVQSLAEDIAAVVREQAA